MIDRALAAGVNFIDTADVYGNDGLSERVIGRWFEQSQQARRRRPGHQVPLQDVGRARTAAARRATRIVRAVEDTLRRLKTDRIDLYQIHMQDIDTPEEETLRALDDLVRAGKVLYLGCSNYAAYRLDDSLWLSQDSSARALRGAAGAVQPGRARARARARARCAASSGSASCRGRRSPSGFLSGKYRKDAPPPAGARLDKWKDRLDELRQRAQLAHPRRASSAVAERARHDDDARWRCAGCSQKPAVTSVIFGARTVAQLDDNLKAARARSCRADVDEAARRRQRLRARLSLRLHEAYSRTLVATPVAQIISPRPHV